MTPQDRAYYEDRFEMMSLPGWKDLMLDVEDMLKATNEISSIQDEKTLHFRRGEISIMRWLLSIQKMSEDTYATLMQEERGIDL